MKPCSLLPLACIPVVAGTLLTSPNTSAAAQKADIVFIIDATSSMSDEIRQVKAGLSGFVSGLDSASIDARFAVVLFGGAPEIVQDFTSDLTLTLDTFDSIAIGAVPGFQNNHNVNPEAGLEAIRMVLGAAPESTLLRNNVGGTGPLGFRNDARKNLILVTDEDSDPPYYGANRFPGESGFGSGNGAFSDPPSTGPANVNWPAWQSEIDATADAVINSLAFINMLINAGDAPSRWQYGNPASSVSDPDFLNFDPDATLSNLIAGGFGNSLEAQVLDADLIGRSFNILDVDEANFIDNFFAAKVEEIEDNPLPQVPEGSTVLAGLALAGLLLATAATRRTHPRA